MSSLITLIETEERAEERDIGEKTVVPLVWLTNVYVGIQENPIIYN